MPNWARGVEWGQMGRAATLGAERIRQILREHSGELSRLGVRRLCLFGSYARGEAGPESDVDMVVEFERPTFDNFMELSELLEEILGTGVDLITFSGLKPRILARVKEEGIDIYVSQGSALS